MTTPLRVLLYSHDSFGLGHLRRSLSLAAALVDRGPHVSALVVSGSPTPDLFRLPPRCEIIKVPSITKDSGGRYCSRSLPMPTADLVALRSALITAAARSFRPHVLLADHTPTGPGDELVPVLRRFRHEGVRTRVILGMRDIIDEPARAREQMAAQGTVDLLRTCFDEIFVYGDQSVFDAGEAYGFPGDVRRKMRYVGIACSRRTRPPQPERSGHRRILVSVGGGEDGYPLLRGVMAALRGPMRDEALEATLVTGPLMASDEVEALRRARQDDERLRVLQSTRAMDTLVDEADLVVSMGGYNSVYEALARSARLLVMPRTWPRREQLERARRLADRGLLTTMTAEDAADPARTAQRMREALERPCPDAPSVLPFDGARRVAALIDVDTGGANKASEAPCA